MNRLQMWLMRKYCPDFEAKMPEDAPGRYEVAAIIRGGYWGFYWKQINTEIVEGRRHAYLRARWLALKAQFWRPQWLEDTGINYWIKELK